VGPPGTEFLFVCVAHSHKPTLADVAGLFTLTRPWPALPPGVIVQVSRAKVELRPVPSSGLSRVGDPVPSGLREVEARLEALRQQLPAGIDLVAGLAFPHVRGD
jgi:hypothetical protein